MRKERRKASKLKTKVIKMIVKQYQKNVRREAFGIWRGPSFSGQLA
jgi:hypothetical protein